MLGGGYDVADAGLAATSATATVLAMAIRVSAALVVRLTRFSYPSSPAVAGDAETADVQRWLDCGESTRKRPAAIPIHYRHVCAGHPVQSGPGLPRVHRRV